MTSGDAHGVLDDLLFILEVCLLIVPGMDSSSMSSVVDLAPLANTVISSSF